MVPFFLVFRLYRRYLAFFSEKFEREPFFQAILGKMGWFCCLKKGIVLTEPVYHSRTKFIGFSGKFGCRKIILFLLKRSSLQSQISLYSAVMIRIHKSRNKRRRVYRTQIFRFFL